VTQSARIALLPGLAGSLFEGRVRRFDVVASTIDECRALADAGADEGTVVTSNAQERGRGQRGNAWFSPAGSGLYLSALLRPRITPDAMAALPLVAGVAACEALRDDFSVDAWIKRPNDILVPIDGAWRKIAGLLVDTAMQGGDLRHAIFSLGVNCRQPLGGFPGDVRDLATSLEAAGCDADADAVAAAFLTRLASWRSRMEESSPAWRADLAARHSRLVRDVVAGQSVEPS
jgi:BirA family biotin operon repressor/biotin-[acetyl-CoA-carboxylase] ligase